MFQKHYIVGVHFQPTGSVPDLDEPNNRIEIMDTVEWGFRKKKQIGAHFFDVKVQAGVNRPRSKVAKQQYVQWLHGQGIVDDEYVVDHSDIDGKDELIKRMKETWDAKRIAMKAQAEQASVPQQG